MKLKWDEAKNRSNIRKHGLDFQDVEEMFRGNVVAELDTREDYGEDRWIAFGMIGGRVTHAVFIELDPDTIRIISLRKATQRESKHYQEAIQDRLEES